MRGRNLHGTIARPVVPNRWREAKIAWREAVASVTYMRGKIGKPPEDMKASSKRPKLNL